MGKGVIFAADQRTVCLRGDDALPSLTKEDIQSALHYAVTLIKDEEYIPYEGVM
jgi:hypothetical protein